MSFLTRFVAAALMAALLVPTTASADFLNPGFEIVDPGNAARPESWVAFAGGATVERNADIPLTGGFDLMMQTNADGSGFAGAYQFFPVSPGDLVTFSAWGRVDDLSTMNNENDPNTEMRMRFEWRLGGTGSGDPNTQINLMNSISEQYQEFTVSDIAPAGVDGVRAVFALNRNDNKFYFDDASITIVPEPTSIAMSLLGLMGLAIRRRS